MPPRKSAPARRTPTRPQPVKRSALRVVILTVVSLGLYQLYWFYITRQQLNAELGAAASLRNYSPGLQTFGPLALAFVSIPLMLILVGFLLIPVAVILSVLVWHYLLVDINQARRKVGLEEFSPGLYVLGYIVLSFVSPANLVIIGATAYQLNQYWDTSTNGRAVEAPYSAGEIIVSLVGLLLAICFIVLMILVGIFADDTDSYEYQSHLPAIVSLVT